MKKQWKWFKNILREHHRIEEWSIVDDHPQKVAIGD